MQLAVIAPNNYLRQFSAYLGNKYYLVLAHRFATQQVYKEFFLQERKTPGTTIILDNGACELGESIPAKKLESIAIELQPDYLVLPDKLHDGVRTLELSQLFLNLVHLDKLPNTKFIGVVQGRTKSEWLETLKQLTENPMISVIGISSTNAVYDKKKTYYPRIRTLKYLTSHKLLGEKPVHILGLDDSGNFELNNFKQYPFIEGADSSAPVVHGAKGIVIHKTRRYQKIREYLPDDATFTTNQVSLIERNIRVLLDIAHYG